MQKLSLYNFLSVVLPGAILTLVLILIAENLGIAIEDYEMNQNFELTIFLSSSIFIGSVINILTRKLLNLYKRIGLYASIEKIYEESVNMDQIKPFFTMIQNRFKDVSTSIQMEYLWSEIYFELEATEKISSAKAFQSFYFFFRNFFTLGLILIPILSYLMIANWSTEIYIILFIANLIGIILSVFAGRWNRNKMVERMFWTYYSLNKNK